MTNVLINKKSDRVIGNLVNDVLILFDIDRSIQGIDNRVHYYDTIFARAIDDSQVSGFSAREINTIGTFAPITIPLIFAFAQ